MFNVLIVSLAETGSYVKDQSNKIQIYTFLKFYFTLERSWNSKQYTIILLGKLDVVKLMFESLKAKKMHFRILFFYLNIKLKVVFFKLLCFFHVYILFIWPVGGSIERC